MARTEKVYTIAYTYLSYHHLHHRYIYKPIQPLVLLEQEWKWNSVVGSAAVSLPCSYSTERNRSSTRLYHLTKFSTQILNACGCPLFHSPPHFQATPSVPFRSEHKKLRGCPTHSARSVPFREITTVYTFECALIRIAFASVDRP